MKSSLKQAWIEDLESDKFKQGTRYLCYFDSGQLQYCCLGVLCECAIRNGYNVTKVDKSTDDGFVYYGRNEPNPNATVLTNELLEEFGMSSADSIELADMNDGGMPFRKIAARIKTMISDESN